MHCGRDNHQHDHSLNSSRPHVQPACRHEVQTSYSNTPHRVFKDQSQKTYNKKNKIVTTKSKSIHTKSLWQKGLSLHSCKKQLQ